MIRLSFLIIQSWVISIMIFKRKLLRLLIKLQHKIPIQLLIWPYLYFYVILMFVLWHPKVISLPLIDKWNKLLFYRIVDGDESFLVIMRGLFHSLAFVYMIATKSLFFFTPPLLGTNSKKISTVLQSWCCMENEKRGLCVCKLSFHFFW